jgi:CHAD domain-containing protein
VPHVTVRTLFDTFDWRLHQHGWLLEETGAGTDAPRVVLRPLDGGPPLADERVAAPRFARDLPPCPLRALLEPVLEPRALLPVSVLETRVEPFTLRSPAGLVTARLARETPLAGRPGEEPGHRLPPRLALGGGRRRTALLRLLAGMPDLLPAPADPLAEALAPLGRAPREYSPKVRVKLDPAMTAQEATLLVLRQLLEAMRANLAGVRAALDPEFLHDFRVAVRRTRSALLQVKGVLPPHALARFTPEFVWLQEVTGPVRDLDVYCQEFPALRALLPARNRRDLAPLLRHLERRREAAHRELVLALDAPRFRRLLGGWQAFLERPAPVRPRGAPNALAPARAVAARRIAKLFARARREGRAIDEASPAADLHELRKTCKKLRYLLEFFQRLFEKEEVAYFVEALKELQDNLGRHQDLQVQHEALAGYARELAREGKARPSAYLAMGMLIERLRDRQAATRREFADRFAPFAAGRNRKRLHRLLAPPGPEPLPPPGDGGADG